KQLSEGEYGLIHVIRQLFPGNRTQLLLVIDQFEEVFTQVEGEDERLLFLNSLVAAVSDPMSPLRVVITVRADFYDRPLLYQSFGDLVRKQSEAVLPLSDSELEEVIVQPAQRVGLTLEPNLVAAIIKDVSRQPGALPLLQYALTELFERRE